MEVCVALGTTQRSAASLSKDDVLLRNAVTILGPADAPALVFGHGYGTDQTTWRSIAETFTQTHRVVLFDYVGSGQSDLGAYDEKRYNSLDGYADDLIDVLEAADVRDAVFVGHSVSGMISALAATRRPDLFRHLVMVCPSPRYVDDGDYIGGFSHDDVLGLIAGIEINQPSWAASLAPAVTARADRPEVTGRVEQLFAATPQQVAIQFARVVFLSDVRHRLAEVPTPSRILQSSGDIICPPHIGAYLADRLPQSTLVQLDTAGHFVHLTEPALISAEIAAVL